MDHYIDIELQPDAEFRENVLMNKVYTKFHKALHNVGANDVGVSFPRWKLMLGRVLRLHATKERLGSMQSSNWLGGLSGYCKISGVLHIPENCQYRVITRIQTTMSTSKLNRLIKRGSIPENEVKAYKAKLFSKGLDNAYLELESSSNGQNYRRYICFGSLVDECIVGSFDDFGLSSSAVQEQATVPWF